MRYEGLAPKIKRKLGTYYWEREGVDGGVWWIGSVSGGEGMGEEKVGC